MFTTVSVYTPVDEMVVLTQRVTSTAAAAVGYTDVYTTTQLPALLYKQYGTWCCW